MSFSRRTEKNLATLLPAAAELARKLLKDAPAALPAGVTVEIISGTRSYEEQAALYAQGRTKPGRKVTNATAGFSNHNFGLAFDIGLFAGGKYLEEGSGYRLLGPIGEACGLEWGGRWKSFSDEPHYQLRPAWAKGMSERDMLAGLRARREKGLALL